jgi:hypothetical protein
VICCAKHPKSPRPKSFVFGPDVDLFTLRAVPRKP